MHELAVTSGFSAAYRLGADYPFKGDEDCERLFRLYLALSHGTRLVGRSILNRILKHILILVDRGKMTGRVSLPNIVRCSPVLALLKGLVCMIITWIDKLFGFLFHPTLVFHLSATKVTRVTTSYYIKVPCSAREDRIMPSNVAVQQAGSFLPLSYWRLWKTGTTFSVPILTSSRVLRHVVVMSSFSEKSEQRVHSSGLHKNVTCVRNFGPRWTHCLCARTLGFDAGQNFCLTFVVKFAH